MSVEVGTAYVTLVPSLKGFSTKTEAALSGVGKTAGSRFAGAFSNSAGGFDVFTPGVGRTVARDAEGVGGKAGGLFSNAFNRAAKSGAGGGVYVAGLLRNLRTYGYAISGVVGLTVGLGLKTASAFQQANVAFTTTLGSARKAKVLFAQLVQFAKVTPFNLPNVVAASQKLLAFGFAAKRVKPILTSLGDAAAGLSLGNDGLDRLVTAVGQISAKGRLQSDELLQLTEAGVPALRILANTFGMTTGKLQAYVQKGLVPASKAIPALLRGLETGTKGVNGVTAKFGGLMAKQSKTLGGIFSNLKDSLSVGLARAVKPLVPVLERALPNASRALAHGLHAAAGAMSEFLHGLGVAKDKSHGTVTGFERLGSVVRGVAHVLSVTAKFVGKHVHAFLLLGGVVLGAVVALKVFNIVMAITNAVMDANPVSLIVLGIGALAAAFIYAWHKSETFRNIVKGVFHVLEFVVGHYAGVVITIFHAIIDVWLTTVGVLVDGAAKAFGWVPGVGSKLKTAASAFDGFRSAVDSKLSALASDAFNLGAAGGSNYAAGFNAAAGLHPGVKTQDDSQAAKLARSAAAGASTVAKATAKQAGPVFKTTGAGLGGALANGIKSGASKAKTSTKTLVDNILGPLRALKTQAAQLSSTIVQAITGDTGFGALANMTDSLGAAFGLSVHSILTGLQGQLTDVVKFRHRLRLLEKRGLSKSAAREIAGEGLVQGGQTAAALLGATSGQLHRISRLRAQTNRAARGLGNDIAGDKYGARITAELKRTHRAIVKASHDTSLSDKTIHRLERAYKRAAKSVQPYVDIREADHRQGKRVRQHS